MAEQEQGGDVDILRQLIDEQRRQLELSPVLLATMKRLLKEQ